MSQEQLENYLLINLKKLEESAKKIVKTQGYNKESERLNILCALIKEQLKNENSRSSARPFG